jgi:hypothetical protein
MKGIQIFCLDSIDIDRLKEISQECGLDVGNYYLYDDYCGFLYLTSETVNIKIYINNNYDYIYDEETVENHPVIQSLHGITRAYMEISREYDDQASGDMVDLLAQRFSRLWNGDIML